MLKLGDEVVLMYALIPRDKYDKLKVPEGSLAKAYEVGKIEDLIDQESCKGWGAMIAIAICRAAMKCAPEAAKILNAAKLEVVPPAEG